ncbi:hypothetical protein D3C80_1519630 [compost metagenome]
MIIGDDDIGCCGQGEEGFLQRRHGTCGQNLATPSRQQQCHALEDFRLVVDAQDPDALKAVAGCGTGYPAIGFCRHEAVRLARQMDAEGRAFSGGGGQLYRMVQHARQSVDDGKTESEAGCRSCTLVQPGKFLEDGAKLG